MLVGYRLYGIWWTAVAQVVSEVGRRSHCVAAGGSAREETEVMMLKNSNTQDCIEWAS